MNAESGSLAPMATLALELHGILLELDPARFVEERAAGLAQSLGSVRAGLLSQVAELPEPAPEGPQDASEKATALAQALAACPNETELDATPWVAFRVDVGPAYEDLVAALGRAGHRVPSLRPTNYARNVFHISSALFALFVIEMWTERILWVASGFFLSAFLMESSRRVSPRANEVLMAAFGKVAHPYEKHSVNSASWYAAALLLLALFLPPAACAVAVVVLGLGDPLAAIVGRRFGRVRLLGGRTLEGSLAFVAAGGLAALTVLMAFHGLGLAAAALVAVASGAAGAVAELLSGRLDDNFTIPVCSAGAAAMVLQQLGALS